MIFLAILLLFVGLTLIQGLITKVVSNVLSIVCRRQPLLIAKKQFREHRTVTIFITLFAVLVLGLGTKEMVVFYLLNGSSFWLVTLSFGFYLFLFGLPWLNLLLPFEKLSHPSTLACFNLSTGTLLLWIVALINPSNKIYTDEAGHGSILANDPLKIVTISLLTVYYLLSLGWLILGEQSIQQNHPKKAASKSEKEGRNGGNSF